MNHLLTVKSLKGLQYSSTCGSNRINPRTKNEIMIKLITLHKYTYSGLLAIKVNPSQIAFMYDLDDGGAAVNFGGDPTDLIHVQETTAEIEDMLIALMHLPR